MENIVMFVNPNLYHVPRISTRLMYLFQELLRSQTHPLPPPKPQPQAAWKSGHGSLQYIYAVPSVSGGRHYIPGLTLDWPGFIDLNACPQLLSN
jgi:hypothetical protein